MSFLALMGVGFLGLASGGFGGAGPTFTDVNAPMEHSSAVEPRAPTGPGIFVPIHKPSHFPFVIIVVDNGEGPAGGWQAAKASLPFTKITFPSVITWYCPLTIQMPIRHSKLGYISPGAAATMSAAVTNSVASGMNFDLPQGVFCTMFRKGVRAAFPAMYPVGATVGL